MSRTFDRYPGINVYYLVGVCFLVVLWYQWKTRSQELEVGLVCLIGVPVADMAALSTFVGAIKYWLVAWRNSRR